MKDGQHLTYGKLPVSPDTSVAIMCFDVDCEHYAIPYSATRGDYFMEHSDARVLCGACNLEMEVVRKQPAFMGGYIPIDLDEES